jgi:hypothetical protein
VAPFGMPPSDASQSRHGLFGNLHKTGRRPDATTCTEMVDHCLGVGLQQLRVEQGGTAPFRERFPAVPTAQQAETILPRHLPDDEVASSYLVKHLAFRINTG